MVFGGTVSGGGLVGILNQLNAVDVSAYYKAACVYNLVPVRAEEIWVERQARECAMRQISEMG
jgi:hypothetical protein